MNLLSNNSVLQTAKKKISPFAIDVTIRSTVVSYVLVCLQYFYCSLQRRYKNKFTKDCNYNVLNIAEIKHF